MVFLYDTKHGTTEKIINNIVEGIKEIDGSIIPTIANVKLEEVNLEEFNDIYIFSPVYYGTPIASVVKFVKKSLNILKQKNVNMIIIGKPTKDLLEDASNEMQSYEDCIINSTSIKLKEYFSKLYKSNLNEIEQLSLSYFLGNINPEDLSEYEKMVSGQNLKWNQNHIGQQKNYGKQIAKRRI